MKWRLNRREWALCLSCLILYVFHLGPYPGVNENRYLDLIRSITEEGRLTIDRFHYNTVDKSWRDGHYYAGSAPGIAMLGAPVYLALKSFLSIRPITVFSQYDTAHYIREEMGGARAPDEFVAQYPLSEFFIAHMALATSLCCVLGALTVILVYRLLRRYEMDESHRFWVLAIYAFGTIGFFYAVRLLAHIPATFCVLFAFYTLTVIQQKQLPFNYVFMAGFALGMGLLIEYTVLPVVMAVGLYGLVLTEKRYAGRFLAGGIIPVGALMAYHTVCFGSPFTTAYSFPMSPDDPGPHIDQMTTGVGGFGLPTLEALWGLSFSGYRGAFMYMPALVFAVYALYRGSRDRSDPFRREWHLIALLGAGQFIFNAMMLRFWSGGYIWGPRYLIPALPFVLLALGPAFRLVRPRWVILTGLISILINWAATQYIVPQHALGGLKSFLLFGPTTQFYRFLSEYNTTYSRWDIALSPVGAWLIVGLLLTAIWTYVDRSPDA